MSKLFDAVVKQKTFVAAPREQVFDAIVSANHWNKFFTHGMTLDPVTGGDVIFRWKDWGPDFYTTEVPGKVIEIKRPRRFVFEWGSHMLSRVSFELSEEFGGTVIRLEESGYADTPEAHAAILECAAGWGEALTLFKFYFERKITYTPPTKP